MSTIEELITKLLNGDTADFTPQSRVEAYLKAAINAKALGICRPLKVDLTLCYTYSLRMVSVMVALLVVMRQVEILRRSLCRLCVRRAVVLWRICAMCGQ